jgi:hypothetical protein
MKIGDMLFRNFEGCSNGDCIISTPNGMHTNSSCKCLLTLSRTQLHILKGRISMIKDIDLERLYDKWVVKTSEDTSK